MSLIRHRLRPNDLRTPTQLDPGTTDVRHAIGQGHHSTNANPSGWCSSLWSVLTTTMSLAVYPVILYWSTMQLYPAEEGAVAVGTTPTGTPTGTPGPLTIIARAPVMRPFLVTPRANLGSPAHQCHAHNY
jgi:hypothetical protein